jgi:Tol biopolymer transport system component
MKNKLFVSGVLTAGLLLSSPEVETPAKTSQCPAAKELSGGIVYSQESPDKDYNIKAITVAGKVISLLSTRYNEMNPRVSPDGAEIVFYGDNSGHNEVYTYNICRKSTKQITKWPDNSSWDPTYTQDGKIVYKTNFYGDKGDIAKFDQVTKAHTKIAGIVGAEDWKPEPTADGLFFTTRRGDNTTDELMFAKWGSMSSQYIRLTENKVADWFPTYNAQAEQLGYISKESAKGEDDIYIADFSRTGLSDATNITIDLPGDSGDPSWSPDGSKMAFINKPTRAGYEIRVYDAESGSISSKKFNTGKGNILAPSFFP